MHVLCAVFIPEIAFADSSQLRLVEGISAVPKSRWLSVSPIIPIADEMTYSRCRNVHCAEKTAEPLYDVGTVRRSTMYHVPGNLAIALDLKFNLYVR